MGEREDALVRVDAAIGERIRRRRVELGLTQEQLACRLGLSYQQIQKYERGANRISASRLYALARRLDVTPGYFFADLEPASEERQPGDGESLSGEAAGHYAMVADERVRSALAGFLRTFVERQR